MLVRYVSAAGGVSRPCHRHLPLARFKRRHEPVQCRHSVTFSSSPSSQSEHARDYNGLKETLGCTARSLSLCLCQSFFLSVRMAARALPLTSDRGKLQSNMNCRMFQISTRKWYVACNGRALQALRRKASSLPQSYGISQC